MAFDNRNWGTIQPGGTQEFLQDGSVIGAPGIYTYQSQNETLLDLSSVDYFSPVGNTLFIGDMLYLSASDGVGIFYVLAVDFETGNLIIGTESSTSGSVEGPATSTPTAIALWNNLTGTLLKNSGVLIDNSNNVTGVNNLTASAEILSNSIQTLHDATIGANLSVEGTSTLHDSTLLGNLGISGTTTGHDFVASSGGQFYFYTSNNANLISFVASDSMLTNIHFTLPSQFPPHDNMALSSLSLGAMSFINCGYGPGTNNAFAGLNVGNETLTIGSALDNSFYGTNIAPGLTTAFQNSFFGSNCGNSLIDGSENCGFGYNALQGGFSHGQSIIRNCAFGNGALGSPGLDGDGNTAVGWQALARIDAADGNIGLGFRAGYNLLTTETGNILIGNTGTTGDNFTIRIGDPATQTSTYLAGVIGSTIASPKIVTIDPITSKLGVASLPSDAFTWVTVTNPTQTISANTGYYVASGTLTTFTLPTGASDGDYFEIKLIVGSGSSFKIAQGVSDQIQVASALTTLGVGGSVSSIGTGDTFAATFFGLNGTWINEPFIGNLDVV